MIIMNMIIINKIIINRTIMMTNTLPAEDENHQEYLLEYLAPLLWREGYVDVDVEDLLQSVLLKHLQSHNIRTTRITFSGSQPSS